MEEKNAIRGQGFTLMVFGGLVALCAVFFILGMVVGRGQRLPSDDTVRAQVSSAAQPAASEAAEEPDEPELEFYEAVTQEEVAPLPPAARTPVPSPPRPSPAPVIPPPPSAAAQPDVSDEAIIFQVGAFGAEATADREAGRVRELGMPAFVSRPQAGSSLFRVRVGPFASADDAERARARLADQGFPVVVVR